MLEADAHVEVGEQGLLRIEVEPVRRAGDVVEELGLGEIAVLIGFLLVGAVPVARHHDRHEVDLAGEHRGVGAVHLADDAVFNDVGIVAVAIELAMVAPPVLHARERHGLLALQAGRADEVRTGRRLEAVVVQLLVIRAEVLEEITRQRNQLAKAFELVRPLTRGLDGDRVGVVPRDAAPLAGVEVGVPVGLRPRRTIEVEREEEVVGRDRLAVCELGVRVEAEVGRHAVGGHRPARRQGGDGLLGVRMRGDQSEVVVVVKLTPEAVVGIGADASKGGRG